MRLGIVLCGEGIGVAAHAGALRALAEHAFDVHALCGVSGGAAAAALYALGLSPEEMQIAAQGAAKERRRILDFAVFGERRAQGLLLGRGLSRRLLALTRGAVMSDCKRALALPCLAALSGKTLAFTSLPGMRARDVVFTREAPLWFAARAAMSVPGLIAGVEWMEVPLAAAQAPHTCIQALQAMGAQQVLFLVPAYQAPAKTDAFTLSALLHAQRFLAAEGKDVHAVELALPQGAGALTFEAADACCAAGHTAMLRALADLTASWGIQASRVLPFPGRGPGV